MAITTRTAVVLERPSQEFVDATSTPPFLYELPPAEARKVLDDVQAAPIEKLPVTPPERALVLCADEKSGIQALDRSAPMLPMMPGMPERCTHDYARSGTTTLFAELEVASGTVIGSPHRRRRAIESRSSSPKSIPRYLPTWTCT
jgi:hypothetical protein